MKNHNLLDSRSLSKQLESEIHIWFCFPDEITDVDKLASYRALLSKEEIKRYQRFIFEKDQHNYLVAHALVRRVLSKYVKIEPAEWQFEVGEHGRPEIKLPETGLPLRFNLTHTKGLGACLVTLGARCGIDAEIIHRTNSLKKIAQRMFSSSELSHLQQLNEVDRNKSFFKFWTLREAYLKAIGAGLAGSSKDFDFDIESNSKISIRFNGEQKALNPDAAHWQFALFEPTEKHISAIAVHAPGKSTLHIQSQLIQP